MDGGEHNRRAKRKVLACEIKVRFAGQDTYTTLVIKDISASGLRVIVTRLVKVGDSLEIKMCINGRDLQCKGKITWVLLLGFCSGGIRSFDAGVEFYEMKSEDREFLEKLTDE